MKTSAWLTLELRKKGYSGYSLHISGVRKTRPLNQLAVYVSLDVAEEVLSPKAEALIEAGLLYLTIEEPEEEE